MTAFRLDIPPRVAETIHALHPDLRHSIKSAVRAIAINPESSEPLVRELDGLWKFRVRRFRIVYAIDGTARIIRLRAVGHSRHVYEALAAWLRRGEG